MKRFVFFLAFFVLLGQIVHTQTVQITGKVTSSEDGQSLPGVSVVVKGTTIGQITDLEGIYAITVPSDATTLVFSFVGMKTQEIEIVSRLVIDIILEPDLYKVDEVIVTALGIRTSRDKLGGSITSVKAENIENTGESGVIQSLAGKTSGLSVVRSSGEPGAGAYMQIRGQSTITGNIQPLIVIDGVPMTSDEIYGQSTGGVTQQSRLNDLNPADIESVEVFKGASAAAVWGTRAANGVLVITTKTGKIGKKRFDVNIYGSFSFDEVNVEYAKQDKFGQGSGGSYIPNVGGSWGDKIADRAGGSDDFVTGAGQFFDSNGEDQYTGYFLTPDGTRYYPIVYDVTDGVYGKNSREIFNDANRDQVFQRGSSRETGVSISVADEKGAAFFSLSNWDQVGIFNHGSDYKRTTIRANLKKNVSDRISARLNTFFSRITSNRIQKGSNIAGLYLGYLRTSPDFDNTHYIGNFYYPNGTIVPNAHRSYRRYNSISRGAVSTPTYNNPGWTIYEQDNPSTVNRFFINPELKIDLSRSSQLTVRYGIDFTMDKRETYFPIYSAGAGSGSYREDHLQNLQQTFDVFNRSFLKISNDFSLTAILGMQYNNRFYNRITGEYTGIINFIDPDKHIYDNAVAPERNPENYLTDYHGLGGYAVINMDIYDQVFVEITGRLEKTNSFKSTIFYPSASLAWQFTKYVGTTDFLSFGKLRASYGTVGVEPDLYITGIDYVAAYVGSGWGPEFDGALYGGHFRRSNRQGNPDIEPERKTEIEFGGDFRFLGDRLSLNATYYSNKTDGAIFPVDVPSSTGYNDKFDNAAEITNKGIELDVTGALIKAKDFSIDLLLNFSKNKNEVTNMSGAKSIFLNGFTGTSSRAVVGYGLGTLWGGKFEKNEDGSYVLDENGFPEVASGEGVLGDPNPDWRGGLGATFRYKGLSLNVLFETFQGGDIWVGTKGVLYHFGIEPETANEVTLSQDVVNYVGTSFTAGTTVRGNIKDFGGGPVLLDEKWYSSTGGGFGPVGEQFVEDGSWTKLREVTLAYDLPKSLLSKIRVNSLNISLTGRNLFLWTSIKYIDPETNLTGDSNGRGLDYFNNPGTRSYLLSFKLGF